MERTTFYCICPSELCQIHGKEERSMAQDQVEEQYSEKPMLVEWEQLSAPDHVVVIIGDQSRELARIKPNGDVEIFGDVNEAALRFWVAVCQQSGGTLTKRDA